MERLDEGHGEQQLPAGLEHPRHLLYERARVGYVLKDLGGEHGPDASGANREVGPVAEDLDEGLHLREHLPHLRLLVEDGGRILQADVLVHVSLEELPIGSLGDANIKEGS